MDDDEWHQVLDEEDEDNNNNDENNYQIDPNFLEQLRNQIKSENGTVKIHEDTEDDLKINLKEAFSVNLQKQVVMDDDDLDMDDADIVFNLPTVTTDNFKDEMDESDDSELQVNLEGHHEEGPVDPIEFATEADQFDDEEIMLNVDRDEDLIGPNWKVDPDYMFSQADFFTEGEPLPEDLALNFATAPTSVHLRLKAPVTQKTILTEYNLSEFIQKWPGRREQIELIVNSMGEPKDRVRPMFIYGDNATGKTSVIRDLFAFLHPPHVFVNCLDSPRYLFETIIDQLNSWNPSQSNNFRSFIRCENVSTFQRVLKSDKLAHFNETIYLIFDHAHKLAEMSPTLLAVLLKLNELVPSKNYGIILISNHTWDSMRDNTFGIEPIIIHFNQYNEKDTLAIIRKDCPQDEDPDFYQNFASQLYQTFSPVCQNVQELRYLSSILFPKYLQPVLEGGLKRSEIQKLHHKAKYLLGKDIVHRLYLRELSEEEINAWDEKKVLQLSRKGNLEFALPKTLKFLLLSAYLASHNPAKYDQRMFSLVNVGSKQHGGMKKMKDKYRSPKAFSLERLLAIYQCITDQALNFNSEISSQISTLVSIKLLTQVSMVGSLDTLKFRCSVTPEFIESVALSINFDLSRYLHDE